MNKKEKIIKAVEGGKIVFVNTDGEWCKNDNPKKFKEFLEKDLGFTVIECKETPVCSAVATTKEGIKISFNGYCRKI